MADPSRYPDSDDHGPDPGAPRWVKAFGIVALVLVLLFVVVMFFGGSHGPGRHSGGGGYTPLSGGAEHVVQRS